MDRDFERLRTIVEEALELPAHERLAALERACGEDAGLLREARGLIDSADLQDSFLEGTPFDAGPRPSLRLEALPVGSQVGPFRLERLLATGGMGAVFEASQERPHRRVALKMLRTTLTHEDALRRFHYEVEALARLQHPSIAQVYETGIHAFEDGGTTHEVPWFALELVSDARSILAHASERGLPERARLELFCRVCDGVHFGHQKGVLHRDLKPDNILIDGHGAPKLIDFGIARVENSELELTAAPTRDGAFLGTLAYASPEQIAGDREAVDVRSDVYALGVVLYELLTDELPHRLRDTSFLRAVRMIREDPPRRPTELRPGLARDLETILLEALRKEPEGRYGSVQALADDVRRYLRDEPIEARPPTAAYQLRLFARRHRVLVGALAAVFVIALAAAGVSLSYAISAENAREEAAFRQAEAEDARGLAALRREEAEVERDRARGLLDSFVARGVQQTMHFAPRMQLLPGGPPLAGEYLGWTVDELEELRREAPDDPRVLALVAGGYVRLAEVTAGIWGTGLGDLDGAVRRYRTAREVADELLALAPRDRESRFAIANCDLGLGRIALLRGDPDECARRQAEARRRLEELVAGDPQDDGACMRLASLEGFSAELANTRGEPEAAFAHAEREVELLTGVRERLPDDPDVAVQYVTALHNLGGGHYVNGRYEQALQSFTEAHEALRGWLVRGAPEIGFQRCLGWNQMWTANTKAQLSRFAEAREHLDLAQETYDAILAVNPDDRRNRLEHAGCLEARASWLKNWAGSLDPASAEHGRLLLEAEESYLEALEAMERFETDLGLEAAEQAFLDTLIERYVGLVERTSQ